MGSNTQSNLRKSTRNVHNDHSLSGESFASVSRECQCIIAIDFVNEYAIANHSSNLGREQEVGSLYKSTPHGRKTADTASWLHNGCPVAAQGTLGDSTSKWIAGACGRVV